MKILFYINVLSQGGAERVVASLSNSFADDNNKVTVVTSFETPNEYVVLEKVKRINLEAKNSKAKNKLIRNFKRIKALKKVIKSEQPDVVISFMKEPNIRAILATKRMNVKTIISIRNDPEKVYNGKFGRWITKKIMPKADGCVFQTEDAKNFFPIALQNKSTIILNPIKEEFFNVQRKPIKGNIVSIGRISPQKNHKLLIDAFNIIKDKYPSANLNIYGEGIIQQEIKDYIVSLKLEERVRLHGHVVNVPEVLSEADFFVLPSDYEGMPNVLMEALASGVPCISTDCPCGGPRSLISDNVNGLLVPVNDIEKLKDAMITLLENDKLKHEISVNAKANANAFKTDVIYSNWKNYVKDIVEK